MLWIIFPFVWMSVQQRKKDHNRKTALVDKQTKHTETDDK